MGLLGLLISYLSRICARVGGLAYEIATFCKKSIQQSRTSTAYTSGASPVCLVDLVCFVYLVVSFNQKTRQTRKTK